MDATELARAWIRQEIAAIPAPDETSARDLEAALAWVDSGVELCRRVKPATPPVHLVSYFVVSDEAAGALLLVDHKNAQLWLPPGGHVEPGEHPRDTVRRELQEELGIALPHDLGPPLMLSRSDTVGRTAGHTDISLWYWLRIPREQALQFDAEEFHGLRWFALDALPLARSDPHLPRFVHALSTHLGHSASMLTPPF
ncbi:NUDIX hydrolase [Paucibacter sp. B51]|uniref:NUDIX hydrolase n=1 Tax=Paucibacter sp. B51 TaxID=2993315 RepID=UPI0022EBFF80|nr:NUDIX hydrolase [Paucibacter sp. B51]